MFPTMQPHVLTTRVKVAALATAFATIVLIVLAAALTRRICYAGPAMYVAIVWLHMQRPLSCRDRCFVLSVLSFVAFASLAAGFGFGSCCAVKNFFCSLLFVGDTTALALFGICRVFQRWQMQRQAELVQEIQIRDQRDEELGGGAFLETLQIAGLPARLTRKELETVTDNFRNPIGMGGSSTVFKGTLAADLTVVAVKRIEGHRGVGDAEFQNEIAVIAAAQHFNLVKLVGFSIEPRGYSYLVYPFFENGSLDAWIFAPEEKRRVLTWSRRYQIAVDVARALAYLHHDCNVRILHLDVKPANVLLDENFRAHMTDFGISRLMARDETSILTRARGTAGYLAPEMLLPNAISAKSDVYSYGMALMEIVGGRRNLQPQENGNKSVYFPKVARSKWAAGRTMEVVDECLVREEVDEEQLETVMKVSLWCIQDSPDLRPSMADVVAMLEGRVPVLPPPESPMYIVNFLIADPISDDTPAADKMELAGSSSGPLFESSDFSSQKSDFASILVGR